MSAVSTGTTIPPARCLSASLAAVDPRRRRLLGGLGRHVAILGHAAVLLPAEHLEPDLLLGDLAGVLADDLALVQDEDPVGEREDLVELERDEQDRPALVALRDDPPVQVLDRADVEPARGLRGDSTFGSRAISRATTTFCWLPPESPPARVSGPPPRTSNSRISRPARSTRRAGKSQPKRASGGFA